MRSKEARYIFSIYPESRTHSSLYRIYTPFTPNSTMGLHRSVACHCINPGTTPIRKHSIPLTRINRPVLSISSNVGEIGYPISAITHCWEIGWEPHLYSHTSGLWDIGLSDCPESGSIVSLGLSFLGCPVSTPIDQHFGQYYIMACIAHAYIAIPLLHTVSSRPMVIAVLLLASKW
jgi:hypothetical protein